MTKRKTHIAALGLSFLLSACSANVEFGRPNIVVPPGDKITEEPNGAVVAEPVTSPIETVITGLQQAQTVRTLTRQLAR